MNSKTDARAAFDDNYSSLGDSSIRAGNKNRGKLRKNFKPQPYDRHTSKSRLKPDVRNIKSSHFDHRSYIVNIIWIPTA